MFQEGKGGSQEKRHERGTGQGVPAPYKDSTAHEGFLEADFTRGRGFFERTEKDLQMPKTPRRKRTRGENKQIAKKTIRSERRTRSKGDRQ